MGMLAVRNMLGATHDLWNLDGQDEYLEEVRDGGSGGSLDLRSLVATQPMVPHGAMLASYEEPVGSEATLERRR
jgi:hypothetical protein